MFSMESLKILLNFSMWVAEKVDSSSLITSCRLYSYIFTFLFFLFVVRKMTVGL